MKPTNDPRFSPARLASLETRLGYSFNDQQLLVLALTHSSFRPQGLPSNERLEFLGDSILGFLVSIYLYDAYPNIPEGNLTEKRARVVSKPPLYDAANKLGLEPFIAVGRGIEKSGTIPRAIVANTMEALVGAVFLDGGSDMAWSFVARHFFPFLNTGSTGTTEVANYKSNLQTITQKKMACTPEYKTVNEEGPSHQKVFTIAVTVAGRVMGTATGHTRKEAEQKAARAAIGALDEATDDQAN